jgi:transcriptional regulator with XRE-family HTH domain
VVVEPLSLAAVLGANCKRIRTDAGVTQDELARHARDFGLRWTASKVRDFEVGRTAPTFATVLALSAALDRAAAPVVGMSTQNLLKPKRREPRVRLADLVTFDGFITVTDEFDPRGQRVADYCAGASWALPGSDVAHTATLDKFKKLMETHPVIDGQVEKGMRVVDLQRMRRASGLAEDRLASRLGISRDRLAAVSFRLWKKPFSQERDRIAGSDANRQKRGQVTRTLRAKLEKELANGNN